MLIREIVATPATATTPAAEQPPATEIQAVTDFVKSVEASKEPPATVLNKFNTFLAAHPMFDVVTDFIPQTRVLKALIGAADALEQNDGKSALASLSTLVTGTAGKAIDAGTRVAGVVGAVDDYSAAVAPKKQTTATALNPQAGTNDFDSKALEADNQTLDRIRQVRIR
jgi:hypothetical protein